MESHKSSLKKCHLKMMKKSLITNDEKYKKIESLLEELNKSTGSLTKEKDLEHFPLGLKITKINADNSINYVGQKKQGTALTRRPKTIQSFLIDPLMNIEKFHQFIISYVKIYLNNLNVAKNQIIISLENAKSGKNYSLYTDDYDMEQFIKLEKSGKTKFVYNINIFCFSFLRSEGLFLPCRFVKFVLDNGSYSYRFSPSIGIFKDIPYGIFPQDYELIVKNGFYNIIFTIDDIKKLILSLNEGDIKELEIPNTDDNELSRSIFNILIIFKRNFPEKFLWVEIGTIGTFLRNYWSNFRLKIG